MSRARQVFLASIWGMSFAWTLTLSTVLGMALMVLPTLFGVGIRTPAADAAHLGGALIVTVSVITIGQVVRIGRWLNVLLALLVVVGNGSSGYSAPMPPDGSGSDVMTGHATRHAAVHHACS